MTDIQIKDLEILISRLEACSIYEEIGKIASASIEMQNDMYSLKRNSNGKDSLNIIRNKAYNLISSYLNIENNSSNISVFKQNIEVILDILKKISNDASEVLHITIAKSRSKIFNEMEYKLKYRELCEDILSLKEAAGF